MSFSWIRSRKRFLLWAIFYLSMPFICIIAFTVWFNSPYSPFAGAFSNGCFPSDPHKMEAVGRFQYPPSANISEMYCAGLQGWIATTKFEMRPNDLNKFVATTYVQSLAAVTDTSVFSEELRKLMEGNNDSSYLYGKSDQPKLLQEILVDQSNSQKYIVYVVVYGG